MQVDICSRHHDSSYTIRTEQECTKKFILVILARKQILSRWHLSSFKNLYNNNFHILLCFLCSVELCVPMKNDEKRVVK